MDEGKRALILDKARDSIIAGNPQDLHTILAEYPEVFQQQCREISEGLSVFDPLLLAAYHGEDACGIVLLQFGFPSDREYEISSAAVLAQRNGCHRLLRAIQQQQQQQKKKKGGDEDKEQFLKRLAAEVLKEHRDVRSRSLHEQAKQAIYNNALSDKSGNTLLHLCAMRDDLPAIVTVHTLAVMGIFVNSQNKLGETALHLAARNGSEPMCRALLLSGANPSLRDRLGQSAVEAASSEATRDLIGRYSPGLAESLRTGSYSGVSSSLQLWVSPHSQLLHGNSAVDFCSSACADDKRFVAIADLVEREAAFLDLLHNVLADNTDGAKALLRRVTHIRLDREHPETGLTLLAAAVRNNNLALVQALLAAGAPIRGVRVQGQPLAHFAIGCQSSFELLLLLLEAGVDASARDSDGFTTLHLLIRSNIPANHFTRVLRANSGENVILLADRLPSACQFRSPREMAIRLGRQDLAEAMDAVVNSLFSEGSREAKGWLMQLAIRFYGKDNFGSAAAAGAASAVKAQFLKSVPVIEQACSDLFTAIKQNNMSKMKQLNEADYQDACGYTALIRAVAAEKYDMAVWVLAERPHQAVIADNEGLTPLHYAYLLADNESSKKFVQLLTKASPVPLPESQMESAADMRGFTACSLRERKGHSYFQQVLRRASNLDVYGADLS